MCSKASAAEGLKSVYMSERAKLELLNVLPVKPEVHTPLPHFWKMLNISSCCIKHQLWPSPLVQILYRKPESYYCNFIRHTYRHCMTSLKQTAFEKSVTKGEITYNEQFLRLPQCFQLQ